MTNPVSQAVLFHVADQQFAVDLSLVDRAELAAEITPIADSNPLISGMIDVRGETFEVYNIRRRLGVPERELDLGDHFLLLRASDRNVAFITDSVTGISELLPQAEKPHAILPGVMTLDDGTIRIADLDRFLDLHGASAAGRANK